MLEKFFRKSDIQSAYKDAERDALKMAKKGEKIVKKAQETIDKEHLEDRRGSGFEVSAKADRKRGFEMINNAKISQERVDYYNEVKDKVGSEDGAVIEKMHEDAIAEDEKRMKEIRGKINQE